MSTIGPTLLKEDNKEKSQISISPTFAKTFRTIRKHFSRTSSNKSDNQFTFIRNEINDLNKEFHSNVSRSTITTVTINESLPNENLLSSFDNQLKICSPNVQSLDTYSFEYLKDKFPEQDRYQKDGISYQSMASKQAVSTAITTHHTRTQTTQSNSGSLIFIHLI